MSLKGAYPYDYIDCFEKFDQTELPIEEQFYSILNDQMFLVNVVKISAKGLTSDWWLMRRNYSN